MKMQIFNQTTYGVIILVLLGFLVAVKRTATGSILEKPEGSPLLVAVNTFNLFFLLVANPLAAILLIVGRVDAIDPSHLTISAVWLARGFETGGIALCIAGYLLMAWALLSLQNNYQLGGNSPRLDDKMVINGPYQLVRHPMYLAALLISLGLACVIQSLAYFSVFCIYLVLMIFLIPVEEERLLRAYGDQYSDYQGRVKRLLPGIY
jgi:protein-S-isoprenylcysteine O-methyltransferase Ste14